MDEMYLKMILALSDEFFEGWEWNDGDIFWLVKDNDGDYTPSEDHGVYTVVDGLLATTGWHDIEMWSKVRGFTLDEGRPIPRQEQLQKLSGLEWDLYYHDLVKNYSEYDSAEQAGLAMIMYMKYGKTWDGEKWT